MNATDPAGSPDLASTRGAALANQPASAAGIAASGDVPVKEQTSPTTPGVPAQEAGASGPRDWAWGAIVVITGLVAIVAVFIFAVLEYKTAAEVTTAVGAVSGVIAALVGAYFGIRGATLAQANAESSSGTAPKTKT
jgi:hypothetical protein